MRLQAFNAVKYDKVRERGPRARQRGVVRSSYARMSAASPLDAFKTVKMGTLREFQLYMVSLQTWHFA